MNSYISQKQGMKYNTTKTGGNNVVWNLILWVELIKSIEIFLIQINKEIRKKNKKKGLYNIKKYLKTAVNQRC